MSASLRFTHQVEQPGDAVPVHQASRLRAWIIGGLVATVLLATVAAFTLTRQQEAACSPAVTDQSLARIGRFYQQGQFGVVAALAQRVLESRTTPALCSDTRAAVAAYWYHASSISVLSKARPDAGSPNSPLATHQVAVGWQNIERQADRYGVPARTRYPARTESIMAGNAGQYELSILAFQQAWMAKMEPRTDLQAIGRYAQMLTTWGSIMTLPRFSGTRDQGIQALATSNSIVTAFGLADDRACRALQGLGYRDCTRVSPDASDPVLASAGMQG